MRARRRSRRLSPEQLLAEQRRPQGVQGRGESAAAPQSHKGEPFALQRQIGNQSMLQLMGACRSGAAVPLQMKLVLDAPATLQELAADQRAFRVTEQLNRTHPSDTRVQLQEDPAEAGEGPDNEQKSDDGKSGFDWLLLAAAAAEASSWKEQEKKKTQPAKPKPVQMKLEGGRPLPLSDPGAFEAAIMRARGKGEPLPEALRRALEAAFGTSLEGVVIHTDEEADMLTRAIGARAFTSGQDIFFRQGEYNPHTRGGQNLLAHELSHVLQQRGPA